MKRVNGKITERLMSMFGGGSSGWNPGRPAEREPKGGKLPKGVKGHRVGGKVGRRSQR